MLEVIYKKPVSEGRGTLWGVVNEVRLTSNYIGGYLSKVSLYWTMTRRYTKMLVGNSYWHLDQGPGKHFKLGQLLGYHNDLTGKTRWEGPVDKTGLPLSEAPDEGLVYFPITLLQKALGHWDLWLASEKEDTSHRRAFLQLAHWALSTQDERGGWETWLHLDPKGTTPYSAMTQGEGISVLVRAFTATGEETYLEGARQALALLLAPVETGGTSWLAPEGLILEEIPLESPSTIPNGWIFALYGLYDFTIVEDREDVRQALWSSLRALSTFLPKYDAGFWLFYDTSGNLASPFYHRLHIAQLMGLELAFPEHARSFGNLRETFEEQLASRANRVRAVALKGYQKLRYPPKILTR